MNASCERWMCRESRAVIFMRKGEQESHHTHPTLQPLETPCLNSVPFLKAKPRRALWNVVRCALTLVLHSLMKGFANVLWGEVIVSWNIHRWFLSQNKFRGKESLVRTTRGLAWKIHRPQIRFNHGKKLSRLGKKRGKVRALFYLCHVCFVGEWKGNGGWLNNWFSRATELQ
jgi:hypothetical protein